MYRSTYINVNLDAIRENMLNAIEFANKEYAFAVVKANAYGHGAIEVSRVAIDAGATHLVVATLDEALELRNEFPKIPILVVGYTEPKYFSLASKYAITLTISNMEQIKKLSVFNEILKIHLKVNTGMNRLGFSTIEEVREAFVAIRYNKDLDIEGLYTHFATSESVDIGYYNSQFELFEQVVNDIGKYFKIIHAQNSAALHYPLSGMEKCNGFRMGLSLYGHNPSTDRLPSFRLRSALQFYTHVSGVLKLKKGSKIGYGATYTMESDGYIATLQVGYADGVLRNNSGRDVAINGKRYPIVGRVCMDQMMILVDETVKIDDKVELIGSTVTLSEVSNYLGTIDYEVLCCLSDRVTRIYYENSEEIDAKDFRYN